MDTLVVILTLCVVGILFAVTKIKNTLETIVKQMGEIDFYAFVNYIKRINNTHNEDDTL